MSLLDQHLLTAIVLAPALGAVLITLLRLPAAPAKILGLLFSLSTAALGVTALCRFDANDTALQFVENFEWIAALDIRYHLGLDGMSLILVLLTAIVAPTALLASWRLENARLFNTLFLLIQTAALGVFLAQDFVFWFLFWELSLIPAFFLIRLWGDKNAAPAAYQFVVYTLGGSAFMLLAFAAIYAATGSLDFPQLAALGADGSLSLQLESMGGAPWKMIAFLGVFIGLAVKVPLFPFHTWLPSAYASAPTGASMFLTGIMSKMGVYGFFRILWPLFPEQLKTASPVLIILALAGVLLGAFAAIAQKDLKRMVAYSSVNHVSYCLLALFAVTGQAAINATASVSALNGALLQMFNHGLSASALFLAVGILENQTGKRGLDDFGGVRTKAPIFAGFCGIALFSSLGLPGLNGFAGEFLMFLGIFGITPWFAAIATLGLFATAWFLLTFFQRVFCGPVGDNAQNIRDLTHVEKINFLPALILMFALGILPSLLTNLFNPLVTAWVNNY